MGLAEPGRPSSERLHAVVVPNMALMRARKIVNVGDILRFELEGLSAALPPHQRVLGYDISFEPLPRTTTQAIERASGKRARERRAFGPRPCPPTISLGSRTAVGCGAAASRRARKTHQCGPTRTSRSIRLDSWNGSSVDGVVSNFGIRCLRRLREILR